MSAQSSKKNEMGIRVLPPFVFLIALIVAFLVEYFVPVPLILSDLRYPIGGIFVLEGIAILVWAVVTFKRAQTTIDVRNKASSLIVTGLYQYSRNPIYIAMMTVCFGIAIIADNIWILPALIAAAFYLGHNVIVLEERYLETKFGDEYREYKGRVGRWF